MVVTRFAPSPTGYLHIGGARTAIFNWLWARHTGGKFLLRIEDTDVKRNTPAAIEQVIEDLKWLGLDWDQGPGIGGEHGPYQQSHRRDIYDSYIRQLLEQGKAYYCFDTAEELSRMRQRAIKKKETFIYPRPESFSSEADAQKARQQGRPVTVRFAVDRGEPVVVKDLVRGEVEFDPAGISDFIIRKSDNFPTYHFACVVDDELMKVTHVIRGQEHLMNTPSHQLLQKALGFGTPEYAHMSVTVSEGGGKLSKRERPNSLRQAIRSRRDVNKAELAQAVRISVEQLESFLNGEKAIDMPTVDAIAGQLDVHLPEINVVDFRKSGYLPEALINFLALLGWNPGDDREIMGRQELISSFDLSRLTKSNSLFDRKKLLAFDTTYISQTEPDRLLKLFTDYLRLNDSILQKADDETLAKLIRVNKGAKTLATIEHKSRFLVLKNDEVKYDEKAVRKVLLNKQGQGLEMLRLLRDELARMDKLTEENVENMLRSLAEKHEAGLGKVAQPLRVAICGSTISPPIFDSVQMLGMDNTLARIDRVLEEFSNQVEQDA